MSGEKRRDVEIQRRDLLKIGGAAVAGMMFVSINSLTFAPDTGTVVKLKSR